MQLSTPREITSCEDTRNFPAFYGIHGSISSPNSQELSTCPYSEPDQCKPPHPISPRSILILSTHLRLGLPSGLFPPGSPTNNVPLLKHHTTLYPTKGMTAVRTSKSTYLPTFKRLKIIFTYCVTVFKIEYVF
jgi:hypothetical protein